MTATAQQVVQTLYEAFGKGDLPTILNHIAYPVDWEFVGPKSLGYTGPRRTREEVTDFFAQVAALDDIQEFEPREFIAACEHVTVLGWERTTPKPAGRQFTTEWIHVWTVRSGKVTRFKAFFDTAEAVAARR